MGPDILIGRAGSVARAWARLFGRAGESGASSGPVVDVLPLANENVACEPATRNSLEIQSFGLRRSGNHAVIAWIAQQYSSPIVFLNSVRPFSDPFATYLMGRVPNAIPERKLNADETEQLRASRKNLLLISYEDFLIRKLSKMELVPHREQWLGKSGRTLRVLLLRDFYNWIASRVKLLENKGKLPDDILAKADVQIRLWMMYAREFVGETRYLQSVDTVNVRFDRWSDEESYRLEILGRLGIAPLKNTRLIVPKVGGGSSFDGTRFSGSAEDMDLHNRWKYLETSEYRPLLQLVAQRHAEVDEYNRQIFGAEHPFG